MKDWDLFNVKYFAIPMSMLVFGMVIGFGICSSNKKPKKEYPIEVICTYQTKTYWYTDYIKADSVKKDTIWKDGLSIVNKNISNVSFK